MSEFAMELYDGLPSYIEGDVGTSSRRRKSVHIGNPGLKAAVLELAQANPEGITNSDASKTLGLQSDYKGGSKDYWVWSLLGLLMRNGKMVRGERKKHRAVVR